MMFIVTMEIEALKPGWHVTYLATFSLRFKMGWMHSYGSVYIWRHDVKICQTDQRCRWQKQAKNVTGKQGLSFIDFWVNKSPGKETYPGTFTVLSTTCLTWVHFTDKSHTTNRDQIIYMKILSFSSLLPPQGAGGLWCHFLFGCLV